MVAPVVAAFADTCADPVVLIPRPLHSHSSLGHDRPPVAVAASGEDSVHELCGPACEAFGACRRAGVMYGSEEEFKTAETIFQVVSGDSLYWRR
jgi:hypothetical protein